MRRVIQTCALSCSLAASFVLLTLAGMPMAESPGIRPSVDPTIARYVPQVGATGSLVIAGSETMQPIMLKLASAFRLWQSGVKVAVQGGGTDAAVHGFLENQSTLRRGDGGDGNLLGHEGTNRVFIMASSRELSAEETKQFIARHGYSPIAIPIAVDAVAVHVHRDNPIEGLTLDQVDAMFSVDRKRGGSERLERWGQIGLSGEWQSAEIRLYGRDRNSGTRAFFKEHVLLNGEFSSSIQEEPGLASLLLAVKQDKSGIGYAGIGFQMSSVRVVPLAERTGMPFVTPTMKTAADGSYPLRRFLYLYLNSPPVTPIPSAIREFLVFTNSREGQEAITKAGVYPLTVEQVHDNLVLMAALGSH